MTRGRLVLRAAARRDLAEAVSSCRPSGDRGAARRFGDALERALRRIADNPGIGSTRYGRELDLPGLRSWRVRPFPHLIFCATEGETTHVWRILHGRRDIPASWRGRSADA